MPADTTLETAIATIANLEEAIADLQQLALEDRGWDRLLAGAQDDLNTTVTGKTVFVDLAC